jgi:hypothetical protein
LDAEVQLNGELYGGWPTWHVIESSTDNQNPWHELEDWADENNVTLRATNNNRKEKQTDERRKIAARSRSTNKTGSE